MAQQQSQPQSRRILVVGGGIVGLTTARSLQRRGFEVLVAAAERGEATTSAGAGGYWMPFHAEPAEAVARWSAATYRTLKAEQQAGGAVSRLIETLPAMVLSPEKEAPAAPPWAEGEMKALLNFESVSGGRAAVTQDLPRDLRVPSEAYQSAWRFDSLVVDCPRYLGALERELLEPSEGLPAKFLEVKEPFGGLESAAAVAEAHSCEMLVNCAGLGGTALAGDDAEGDMMGGRGVILVYARPPSLELGVLIFDEGPLASADKPMYVIPRGDVVVVGGTYEEGLSHSMAGTPEELARLKANAAALIPELGAAEPLRSWVGLRPVRRAGVRHGVAAERCRSVHVAHNYGHGGAGWTTAHGCSEELAEAIAEVLPVAGSRRSRL